VRQGIATTYTYTGKDIIDERIYLPFYNFDYGDDLYGTTTYIQIQVNGETWTRIPDFYYDISGLTGVIDNVYMFRYDKYQKYIVEFSPTRNVPVEDDILVVTVLRTAGSYGNVAAYAIDTAMNDFIQDITQGFTYSRSYITLITNTIEAYGGLDPETLDIVRDNSDGVMHSQYRNVTKKDYVDYLESRDDIIAANAWGARDISPSASTEDYNKVFVSLIPDEWGSSTIDVDVGALNYRDHVTGYTIADANFSTVSASLTEVHTNDLVVAVVGCSLSTTDTYCVVSDGGLNVCTIGEGYGDRTYVTQWVGYILSASENLDAVFTVKMYNKMGLTTVAGDLRLDIFVFDTGGGVVALDGTASSTYYSGAGKTFSTGTITTTGSNDIVFVAMRSEEYTTSNQLVAGGTPDDIISGTYGSWTATNTGPSSIWYKSFLVPQISITGSATVLSGHWVSEIIGFTLTTGTVVESHISTPLSYSTDWKKEVSTYLEQRKMLSTYEEYIVPALVYFSFDIGLYLKRSYVFDDVADAVLNKLIYYFDPSNRSFNETISFIDIQNFLIDPTQVSPTDSFSLVKGVQTVIMRDIRVENFVVSAAGTYTYPQYYESTAKYSAEDNQLKLVVLGFDQFPMLYPSNCKITQED
jgi:hypothetical protein